MRGVEGFPLAILLYYMLLYKKDLKITPKILRDFLEFIWGRKEEKDKEISCLANCIDITSDEIFIVVKNNPLLFSQNESGVVRSKFSAGFFLFKSDYKKIKDEQCDFFTSDIGGHENLEEKIKSFLSL